MRRFYIIKSSNICVCVYFHSTQQKLAVCISLIWNVRKSKCQTDWINPKSNARQVQIVRLCCNMIEKNGKWKINLDIRSESSWFERRAIHTRSGSASMSPCSQMTVRCTSAAKSSAATRLPSKIFTKRSIVLSWLSFISKSIDSPSPLVNVVVSSPWMWTSGYCKRATYLTTEGGKKQHRNKQKHAYIV